MRIEMLKKCKILTKKICTVIMILGILYQTITPVMVLALDITSFEDGNTITISGNPTLNGSIFEYEHGDVTITKTNGSGTVSINSTSFTVAKDDVIVISLTPDDGYSAQLYKGEVNIGLTQNSYSFKIGSATSNTLSFNPSFVVGQQQNQQDSTSDIIKFDFTINGESFTNVGMFDKVTVSDDFNMDKIESFYITKIAIEGGVTKEYATGEYSFAMLDNEDRRILEMRYTKKSDNYGYFWLNSHNDDILPESIPNGKTKADYLEIMIPNIGLIKNSFKGVEVSTETMLDNYDFTVWNGADLKGTTKSNPGMVTAYYGENIIEFSSTVLSRVSEISLVSDSDIPEDAISINNTTGEITILSNYYNKIPLKIKLEDGTTGYITVNRIGIFIGNVNAGEKTFYHGASFQLSNNLDVDTDKNRIAAVFYHEDTTTYEDYDLIVNITYDDGSTETTVAQGVGDVHNSSGSIIGSDYILWKGNANEPKEISVTAIEKDALSNDNTFGGATFGSGTGVKWEKRQGGNE